MWYVECSWLVCFNSAKPLIDMNVMELFILTVTVLMGTQRNEARLSVEWLISHSAKYETSLILLAVMYLFSTCAKRSSSPPLPERTSDYMIVLTSTSTLSDLAATSPFANGGLTPYLSFWLFSQLGLAEYVHRDYRPNYMRPSRLINIIGLPHTSKPAKGLGYCRWSVTSEIAKNHLILSMIPHLVVNVLSTLVHRTGTHS